MEPIQSAILVEIFRYVDTLLFREAVMRQVQMIQLLLVLLEQFLKRITQLLISSQQVPAKVQNLQAQSLTLSDMI